MPCRESMGLSSNRAKDRRDDHDDLRTGRAGPASCMILPLLSFPTRWGAFRCPRRPPNSISTTTSRRMHAGLQAPRRRVPPQDARRAPARLLAAEGVQAPRGHPGLRRRVAGRRAAPHPGRPDRRFQRRPTRCSTPGRASTSARSGARAGRRSSATPGSCSTPRVASGAVWSRTAVGRPCCGGSRTWSRIFLPQTFLIEVEGEVVATMRQNLLGFPPRYTIDLSHDARAGSPGPLAVATVILLLAVEGPAGDRETTPTVPAGAASAGSLGRPSGSWWATPCRVRAVRSEFLLLRPGSRCGNSAAGLLHGGESLLGLAPGSRRTCRRPWPGCPMRRRSCPSARSTSPGGWGRPWPS